MNFDTIIKLATRAATIAEDKEFGLDSMSSEIGAALKEAFADERKATVKAAALQIVQIVKYANNVEQDLVNSIRHSRAMIARNKETLAKIKEAKAYGAATDNYIPLCSVSGIKLPGTYEVINLVKMNPIPATRKSTAK